jgi:hypothetical protein
MAQAQEGQNNQQQGGGGFMGGFMNRILMLSVLYFMFVGNPFKATPKDATTGAPLPPSRNLMPEYYDLVRFAHDSSAAEENFCELVVFFSIRAFICIYLAKFTYLSLILYTFILFALIQTRLGKCLRSSFSPNFPLLFRNVGQNCIFNPFFGTISSQHGTELTGLLSRRFQDLWVYVSESDASANFDDAVSLVWYEKNIRYDDWADENYRKKSLTLVPSPTLVNNGSMYAHIIMARHGTPTTAFTSAKGKPLGLIIYKVHRTPPPACSC